MRIVFYTNNISPHQLPVAREVMRMVGRENFLYVGEEIAWNGQIIDAGEVKTCAADSPWAQEWMENAEVLYTGGLRPIDLLERRAKRGLKSLYCSERWFKPLVIGGEKRWRWRAELPGSLRMLVPSYRKMAKRFVKLVNENDTVRFLSIGPWSRRDFLRLGVHPSKLVDWGYFVEPSTESNNLKSNNRTILKILWVGRLVGLKGVDTIVRAVREVSKFQSFKVAEVQLTIVGDGPEKSRLQQLAKRLSPDDVTISQSNNLQSNNPTILFLSAQPNVRVRELMREHDVFVFASDENEGWGAVVSEALEEGMNVIGTFEAGASAAILPRERLFHAGDWKGLAELIRREARGELPPCDIGEWTAAKAAERLINCDMFGLENYENNISRPFSRCC